MEENKNCGCGCGCGHEEENTSGIKFPPLFPPLLPPVKVIPPIMALYAISPIITKF